MDPNLQIFCTALAAASAKPFMTPKRAVKYARACVRAAYNDNLQRERPDLVGVDEIVARHRTAPVSGTAL